MRRLAFPLAFVLASAAAVLAANGAKPIALSPRAHGRGGADVAVADDAFAIHSNPAGMAWIDGSRFDGGFQLIAGKYRFRTTRDSAENEAPPKGVPSFGYVYDPSGPLAAPRKSERVLQYTCPQCKAAVGASELQCPGCGEPFEPLAEDLDPPAPPSGRKDYRFGLALLPQEGGHVDFKLRSAFFGAKKTPTVNVDLPDEPQEYMADFARVALAPAVAVRVNERLSLGGALHLVIGKLEKDAPSQVPSSLLVGSTANTVGLAETYAKTQTDAGLFAIRGKTDMDDTAALGLGGALGMLYRPTGRIALGLTYSPPSLMDPYRGNMTIDFNRQIEKSIAGSPVPGARDLFNSSITKQAGNPALGYAGAYNLKLENFQGPQQVRGGLAYRTDGGLLWAMDVGWIDWSEAMDELKVELTDGSSVNLNIINGQPGVLPSSIPLHWRDQLILATGLDIPVGQRSILRVGYNYGNNPVPRKTLQPTEPAFIEHHATLGFSHAFERWDFHAAYEHGFYKGLSSDRNIANDDLSGSSASAASNAINLGVSRRF